MQNLNRYNLSLNDETNSTLEELFTDLNVSHLDEEINQLFQIIGKLKYLKKILNFLSYL